MESLPDDVCHHILQIGIQKKRLNHTDLCSLAMVNRRFDQLTQDPALWATLISRDLSNFCLHQAPSKATYRQNRWIRRQDFERRKQAFECLIRAFERRKRERERVWLRLQREFQRVQEMIHARSSLVNLARVELNLPDVIIDDEYPGILRLPEKPNLRQPRKCYTENMLCKRFDKSSRPKVIPNSKSYIPMNRPPRRSMPRKI